MLTFLLLQADTSAIMGQVFLFGAIILIMYFFMIRPQQQKQKETKNFLEAVKKGDPVVTIGGLHGKVHSVEADTLTIELDRGLKVTIEKTAVSLDYTKRATGK
ncbi:preprotein translocase subunit YajC [Nitritalea halalkaliphila LW7]|uniref:Sec translocon accessory complex subunit YajC n=1 Tax=Nitritalea halalkaliphila LW7 TaxID=1189621 RepID=I5CAD3_9BACT|nr:preprotein translocase subunit YajC [Nitritalea halalkaliphila]EIM78785.1 preprotein translocase subunit YajC [Nitritalea halalkaliphila LW7]